MEIPSKKSKNKKGLEDLNLLYTQAETADKEIFAEQRSNVQLISGNHYTNKNSRFDRIRDNRDLTHTQKLRLTKNHIQKITKAYVNHIVEAAPGIQITARNDRDIHHQKSATLNASVWQYAKDTQKLESRVIDWAKDFIDLGEVFIKIFWDPTRGKFKGYNQALDPMGQPEVDEDGSPAADYDDAVFQGELVIEKILACNVLRDPQAQTMDEAEYLIIRKMVPHKTLKAMVGDDPEKLKALQPGQREEYMVFDASTQGYEQTKDMVLLREYFFRPSPCYPQGYFYIATKYGILFEGELPFGIFPITYCGFDSVQTSPRHRSIVKQLRAYQIEINRTASKIAETQTTSDDKLLIQTGTKVSSGAVLPGVRTVQYTGVKPEILSGRTGEQYLPYLSAKISEMYQVASVPEALEDKDYQADPMGMLFRSAKDKKKFVIYISKFELFLKEVCLIYLNLAKNYFNDEMLIPMVGKNEFVNIAEFRQTGEVQLSIQVRPMSDDVNTMFGKALAINHALQYVGPNMKPDQVGHLLRQMPFANFEDSFSDLTMDFDGATNLILALERGEQVEPSPSDTKEYMIKRLDKRMRESDFRMLAPQVQQNFLQIKQAYQSMIAEELKKIQAAQQGFIPTEGALIKTDMNVEMPNSIGGMKTTRAAFPYKALEWLDMKLKEQGMAQERLQGELSQAEISDVSSMLQQPGQGPAPQEPPPSQGPDFGMSFPA
jgi:hypothetical protein